MKTALALCLLAATAFADPQPTAELTAHNDKSPTIDAALINAPKASKITLTSGAITMNATKPRAFAQSGEPILIAIVVQADETWAKAELKTFGDALDSVNLTKLTPPDSYGMMVAYSFDTQTKVAMGPLVRLKGKELGTLKDYKGKKGASIAPAVTFALSELAKVDYPHKVLIVVGDGNDSDPKSPLADLAKQAAAAKVQLAAVVTKTGSITKLVPTPIVAADAADVGKQFVAFLNQLTTRNYVTFPVGKLIPFDGKEHEFVVGLDDLKLPPIKLTLK
jgi:hypothetical protein